MVKYSNIEPIPLPLLTDATKLDKLTKLTDCLVLSKDVANKVRQTFEDEMTIGLMKDPPKKSSLQMENTFLPELPDGTEDGYYMALDLGGTHFRVILIHFKAGVEQEPLVKFYSVNKKLRLGPGTELFDYLAACLYDFMKENNVLDKVLPLGFTFSFPMIQKALDIGILVTWTKSFNSPGVVGNDAVKMLKDAIKRRGDINVEVVAVLNDTTGTLVQGAYLDKEAGVGLILGTGSNACYIEKADRIKKWEESHEDVKEVIVDIEWGAFGDNGVLDFIKTEFDREVDNNSLLVNSFTFEKYFAGRYLGELARVILAKLVREGVLFNGVGSEKLFTIDGFSTAYVSHIEEDQEDTINTSNVLKELDLLSVATKEDIEVIRYVCNLITVRAARLISACIGQLLVHMDRPETTIAVDGSLYKLHPKLRELMLAFIPEVAPKHNFKLLIAEDGSGKGAGLVAALATRLAKHKMHPSTDRRS